MSRLDTKLEKEKSLALARALFNREKGLLSFLCRLDRKLGIETSTPREQVLLYGRGRSAVIYSESLAGILIAVCRGLVIFDNRYEDHSIGVLRGTSVPRVYEIEWLPEGYRPYELSLRFDTPISMGRSSSGPAFAPAWISEEWGGGSGGTLGIDPDRAEILEKWIQKWGLRL